MDEVGFDPGVALPEQKHPCPEKSGHTEGVSTPRRSPDSIHSIFVLNSHPSSTRPSDASEANNTVLSPSQSPLQEVISRGSTSSGVHVGGLPRSLPPPPPPPPGRGNFLHVGSPGPSESSMTTTSWDAKPSSAKPDAKKCQEGPKHTFPVPSVGSGRPNPPPPPSPPLRPPPPSVKKGVSPGQAPPPASAVQIPFSNLIVGKDWSPLPKLRPLYWDKVRAAPDRSTVWDEIRSNSFELDEELIKSLFSCDPQSSERAEKGRRKATSPRKYVIEPKRLQNLAILLKALDASSDQILEALLRGTGLCARQLEALVKMVPTKEEKERLLCLNGDISMLASTERFIKEMLSVPFSFTRVEAMLYRETFEDEVAHLRKPLKTLEKACKELRSSRLFLRLLETVLKTGNRMNVGTMRGGARAFKLDTLLRLADVKGTDGRTTLLHFVVQEIVRLEGAKSGSAAAEEADQKHPKAALALELVSVLSSELCHVKTAAAVDLDALAGSISSLSTGLEKLHHLLDHHDLQQADTLRGGFVHSMRSFSDYAERTVRTLEEDEGRVLRMVREITEYYYGDAGKEERNPLRIFVIVRDFLAMLDRVCTEVRSWKGHHSPTMGFPFTESVHLPHPIEGFPSIR